MMGRIGGFTFLLLFYVGTVKGELLNGCPANFFRIGSLCMFLTMDQQPWKATESKCQEKNPEAVLAPVKDLKLYQWLSKSVSTDIPFSILLGLKYTSKDKIWRWTDGTIYNPATDWSVWRNGKVPTPNTDRCGIWKKAGKVFEWDVTDCATSGIYICSMNATTDSQNCPDGYLQNQDMCWMPIMKLDHSYNTGLQQCQEAKGNPPITKTEIEYARFISIFGNTISQLPASAWFGLKYVGSEKKWKWADGTNYNPETQVNLWENQQLPTEVDTEDVCVNLVVILVNETQTFQWGTTECDNPSGFMLCAESATINVTTANGCPLHFSRTGNHCTYSPYYAKRWINWERDCKVRGGSLFAPKNLPMCQEVLGKGGQDGTGCVDMQNNWSHQQTVGLKYIAKEKTWRWSDGTVYNPATDWALWRNGTAPKPDHDMCVVWAMISLYEFKWDPVECNNEYVYVFGICYAKATADAQVCADGYTLEGEVCIDWMKQTQASYGYDDSQALCKNKSDGFIFRVQSDDDVDLLLSQHEGYSAVGMQHYATWVGVKYEVSEKKWKWSDGTEYKMGVDYGNWDDVVPATPTEDSCIALAFSSVDATDPEAYKWRVRSCKSTDFVVYFCENELLSETQEHQTAAVNMAENVKSASSVTHFNPETSASTSQKTETPTVPSFSSQSTSQALGVTTSSTTLSTASTTDRKAETTTPAVQGTASTQQMSAATSQKAEVPTIIPSSLPISQTPEVTTSSTTDIKTKVTAEKKTEITTSAAQVTQSSPQISTGTSQNTEVPTILSSLSTSQTLGIMQLPDNSYSSSKFFPVVTNSSTGTTTLKNTATTDKKADILTPAMQAQSSQQMSTGPPQKLEMPVILTSALPTIQTLVAISSNTTDLKSMAIADKKVTPAVPVTQPNQQISTISSKNSGAPSAAITPILPAIQILEVNNSSATNIRNAVTSNDVGICSRGSKHIQRLILHRHTTVLF